MKLRLAVFLVFCGLHGYTQIESKQQDKVPFNLRNGLLNIRSGFGLTPSIQFSENNPSFESRNGFVYQFGLGYSYPLSSGFNFSLDAFIRSYGARMIDNYFFEDEVEPIQSSSFFHSFQYSIPLYIEKRINLSKRSFLAVGLGLSANYSAQFPITNLNILETIDDSTSGFGLNIERDRNARRWGFDTRLKIGLNHAFKSGNEVGFSVFGVLSPNHSFNDEFNATLNGVSYSSGSASQSLSHAGIELNYGFTLMPYRDLKKVIGPEDEQRKTIKFKDLQEPRFTVSIGTGLMALRQKVIDPFNAIVPATAPWFKHNLSVEWGEKINYRTSFFHYQFWEARKQNVVESLGVSMSGTDAVFGLSAEIGKDVFTSKNKKVKLKPWIGVASSVLPYAFDDFSDFGGGGTAISNGDQIVYSDSSRSEYPTGINFYLNSAIELEWTMFKYLKMSLMPSYAIGFREMNRQFVTYSAGDIVDQEAEISVNGTHWSIQLFLKVPIRWKSKT